MELPLHNIKNKQRLIYQHCPGWTTYDLKVICKENWGGCIMIKCKVLTKGWYEEVYITEEDFLVQAGTNGFSRVTLA